VASTDKVEVFLAERRNAVAPASAATGARI